MFGRNTTPDQKPPTAAPSSPAAPQAPTATAPAVHAPSAGQQGMSVIGNDLSIVGQKIHVVSQSRVQVDGHVEGDVSGREVIIGENGNVHGTITADAVEVRGMVQGAINAGAVALQQTARVEGDINHKTLTIAEGAQFDGRVRRPEDPAELSPNLDVAALALAAKG